MEKVASKSIAELAPNTSSLKEHQLKGTIKVFLKTKKFREISEGILKKPVCDLYPEWKKSVFEFLSLKNKGAHSGEKRIEFFKKVSETFFMEYALESVTEFWTPTSAIIEIAKKYSELARQRYEALCYRKGIDTPMISNLLFPFKMNYVPLDWGLDNIRHSKNDKREEHLDTNFRPLFETLLKAQRKGNEEFSKKMNEIENGNTDVQLNISLREPFLSNVLQCNLAHNTIINLLSDGEKEIFTDCIRLNEQFTIMNDLHGGFAMFNADIANKIVKEIKECSDEEGKKEVGGAGWCWRQIGVLYLLLEQDRLQPV